MSAEESEELRIYLGYAEGVAYPGFPREFPRSRVFRALLHGRVTTAAVIIAVLVVALRNPRLGARLLQSLSLQILAEWLLPKTQRER